MYKNPQMPHFQGIVTDQGIVTATGTAVQSDPQTQTQKSAVYRKISNYSTSMETDATGNIPWSYCGTMW